MLTASIAVLACAVVAADQPGLRARGSENDYQARVQGGSEAAVSLGAERLSADEVRNTFATDLNRGFIVVEVGVFPVAGKTWSLNPSDFSLRIGSDKMVRPATPATVASILQRKSRSTAQRSGSSGPGDITLYPSATIGYESVGSGGGIDPVTGRPRRGGWVGGGGVGVGMGGNNGGPTPPPPASTDADRSTMQAELWDKSLPEGDITRPIAGYLYFPIPVDQKKSSVGAKALELVYNNGADVKLRVSLPAPK